MINCIWDNDERHICLFTEILLDQIAVLLILEFITGIFMHKGIILIMLAAVIFDGQTEFLIVEIELEIFLCDGIFQEIGTNLGKGFLEIEFDKFFASDFSLAGSTLAPRCRLFGRRPGDGGTEK